MQLVLLTTQKTLLILKGPYTPAQQTAIQAAVPSGVTVMFVGNENVDSMDALAIQFTSGGSGPTTSLNIASSD